MAVPPGDPAPYDLIADSFSAARVRLQANEARYLRLVLESLAPASTVLDLGCGTGQPIATYVAGLGHHVVGVDASARMLARARARLPDHRWIRARIERVELNAKFDAVICWDALFHVRREEWPSVLERIRRWLRPAGRLMLSSGGVVDPNGHGFTDTMFGQEFYYDSLAPDVLLDLLMRQGFEIVLAEMCDLPGEGRNRGKWATVAALPPAGVPASPART